MAREAIQEAFVRCGPGKGAIRRGAVLKRQRIARIVTVENLEFDYPMCFVCPRSHRFANEYNDRKRDRIDQDELESETLISLHPRFQPGLGRFLSQDFRLAEHRIAEHMIYVSNYGAVLGLVRAQEGIGLMPGWRWMFQEYEQQGQIVCIPVELPPTVGIGLYLRKGCKLSAAAQQFARVSHGASTILADTGIQRPNARTMMFPGE